MKKIKCIVYIVTIIASISLIGCDGDDGGGGGNSSPHSVNFFNNIAYSSGNSMSAKLETSAGTWTADSGEYSSCKSVSNNSICDIRVYFDGDYKFAFNDCLDIEDCTDATLLLTLEGSSTFVLKLICHDDCGNDILNVQSFEGFADIVDTASIINIEVEIDLFSNLNDEGENDDLEPLLPLVF